MGVTIKRQLTGNAFGQGGKGLGIGCREVSQDVFALCVSLKIFILSTVGGKQVVEFINKTADGRNKLDEALRDEHHTKVLALLCTISYGRSHLLDDLVEGHILCLHLLGDDANVGLALERTL